MGKRKFGYEWIVLSVTTIGALLASMQSSALLIALPELMGNLNIDFLTIMWVILAYMLMTTVMLPIVGRLADIYGRKKLYLSGFAIFTIASLLCCFSVPQFNGWDLVVYRAIQGLGGSLLLGNSTALVADAFDSRRLGLGLGINQVAGAAGIVLGPVVGGLLVGYGWWAIFAFNVPLGIIGTLWGIKSLRETVMKTADNSFDVKGCLSVSVGLTFLLLGITLLAFPMIDMIWVWLMIVVGAAALIVFIYTELKVRKPMINLRLFKNRSYAVSNFTNFTTGLARSAILFALICYFQGPYGMDPLTAGLALIPYGLGFMVLGPIAGRLSDNYGTKYVALSGLILMALGLLCLTTIDEKTSFMLLAAYMLIIGIGSGLFSSPNSSTVMKAAPPEERGSAASTRMMLMNAGGMFSFTIAFPVLFNGVEEYMEQIFIEGGGVPIEILGPIVDNIHETFLIFFIVALISVIIGFFQQQERGLETRKR